MSDSSEETHQTVHKRWKLAQNLCIRDVVTINDYYSHLTVVNIEEKQTRAGEVKSINLTDDSHTKYNIHITTETVTVPTIRTPSTTKNITSITAENQTILSDTKINKETESQTKENTRGNLQKRTNSPTITDDDMQIIGDCPLCDCILVKQHNHIICTNCGSRCHKDSWESFQRPPTCSE